MKIRCEILSVETHGESLSITLQGKGKSDADWRPMVRQIIGIASTQKNQKQFHVGRTIEIEVLPK